MYFLRSEILDILFLFVSLYHRTPDGARVNTKPPQKKIRSEKVHFSGLSIWTAYLLLQNEEQHDRQDDDAQDDPGEGAGLFFLRIFLGDVVVIVVIPVGLGPALGGGGLLFFQVLDQSKLRIQRLTAGAAKDTRVVIDLAAVGAAFGHDRYSFFRPPVGEG